MRSLGAEEYSGLRTESGLLDAWASFNRRQSSQKLMLREANQEARRLPRRFHLHSRFRPSAAGRL